MPIEAYGSDPSSSLNFISSIADIKAIQEKSVTIVDTLKTLNTRNFAEGYANITSTCKEIKKLINCLYVQDQDKFWTYFNNLQGLMETINNGATQFQSDRFWPTLNDTTKIVTSIEEAKKNAALLAGENIESPSTINYSFFEPLLAKKLYAIILTIQNINGSVEAVKTNTEDTLYTPDQYQVRVQSLNNIVNGTQQIWIALAELENIMKAMPNNPITNEFRIMINGVAGLQTLASDALKSKWEGGYFPTQKAWEEAYYPMRDYSNEESPYYLVKKIMELSRQLPSDCFASLVSS